MQSASPSTKGNEAEARHVSKEDNARGNERRIAHHKSIPHGGNKSTKNERKSHKSAPGAGNAVRPKRNGSGAYNWGSTADEPDAEMEGQLDAQRELKAEA